MRKTNAMRDLDARGIPYEVFTFSPEIHSASGVAAEVGVPPEQVYKTLVVLAPDRKPLLVLAGGDTTLSLKQVAQAVGEKSVRMATHREAEAITGLKVGGISALALLKRSFPVLVDRQALAHSHVLVSAGRRGTNLRLGVPDLIALTSARVIDATG